MSALNTPILPVKYNGNQLDEERGARNNYALTLDYLVLNFTGAPCDDFAKRARLVYDEYGTQNFVKKAKLYYDDLVLGIMTFEPRSEILDKNLVQLKLENSLFYTLEGCKIAEVLNSCLSELQLRFKGVSRLDIALDFEKSTHNIPSLLLDIFNKNLLVSGRTKDFNIYSTTKKGSLEFQGFSVGKRSGARFLRCYDKSKEQTVKEKTYITDYHKSRGLSSDIWRFEYQLTSAFFLDLGNVSLKDVLSKNFQFNLFKMAISNHFELKKNQGRAEINKNPDYNLFNFTTLQSCINVIKGTVYKHRRIIVESLIGQKRIIKGLLRSYFSTSQNGDFLTPVRHTITDYGLYDWLFKKIPIYLLEFERAQIISDYDEEKFYNDLAI